MMAMHKLRFKADDGSDFPAWKCKTLGELGTFQKGAPLSKAAISDNGTPLILYGELYTTYEEVAYNIVRRTEKKVEPKFLSHIGDVLIPTSGETAEEISTATCVMQEGVILGSDLLIYRPVPWLDGRILSYVINHQVKQEISRVAQGPQIVHVNKKDISKIKAYVPSSQAEQRKITEFLDAIDDIIAKQQAEIEAWEQYKKGVAQKLFSQEVRFKADDGSDFPAWESIPLAMACDINPKTEPLAAQFYYMDLNSVDSGQWNEPQLLQRDDAPSRAQRVATLDDVFFQSVRPYNQGHYHITRLLDKQIVASTGFIQTRMRNGCNSFLYHMFFEEGFNKEINLRCTGSNYPAINATEFGKIVISLPSSPEQRKIAECLDAIDEVIALAKAELEKWHELKKGLLQQLFVSLWGELR